MYKTTSQFKLRNSSSSNNAIEHARSLGIDVISLNVPKKIKSFFNDKCFLIEFDPIDKAIGYDVCIYTDDLLEKEEYVYIYREIAKCISFVINIDEANPHHGTFFIEFNSDQLRSVKIYSKQNNRHIEDIKQLLVRYGFDETKHKLATVEVQAGAHISVSICVPRSVIIDEKSLLHISACDITQFYYDGLVAEYPKSKYFHWFLILESLEHSDLYKKMFNDRLFDDTEEKAVRDLAEQMNDGTKKGAILQLLSRTKEVRKTKLLKLL
ncbi:MAG: hypothetical protein D3908_09485, partial [Candidatus Electrothrix sp. AUS4]|nr:hypothetical protein [Candidatus Electrothrix sp. AUS4]